MVNWPTTGRTPGLAMDYIRQFKVFTSFSQLFESRADVAIKVDNAIFRLHSQWTVMILMVGTMFVSMRQHFGEPIECLAPRSDIPPQLLQHYCWIEATFSVVDGNSGKAVVGNDVAYPGVKTFHGQNGERKVFHKYYQWVYFVLIIQAIMFYIPKYLWKAKEDKRLKNLIYLLQQRNILEWNEIESRKLTQDVLDSLLISSDYFFFFFFCEFLYYIHLISQMWFVNIFLSGQFLRLGLDWLIYSNNDHYNNHDPLIRVFPRMTKCLFHKYGYSGAVEKHDALCFLPLNIVNEKIYVVLWFWFAFLLVVTSISLVNRIFIVLFPILRYKKLVKLAPSTDKKCLRRLTSRVGNWFILHNIASNIKPSQFRDLINFLIKEHFDNDCNLVYGNNKTGSISAMNNKINPMNQINMNIPTNKMKLKYMGPNGQMLAPTAPMQTVTNPVNKLSKKVNMSSLKHQLGFNRATNKGGNFSNVNRDPPSGHSADSDDWRVNIAN